jgi:hypothetical protein
MSAAQRFTSQGAVPCAPQNALLASHAFKRPIK